MNQFETTWSPADHTATWPAKPAYPEGETIDEQPGAPRSCLAALRYPAPCCGTWSIHCRACRKTVVVTAAGLADDPCSVRIGCQSATPRTV
jgi:hypothetical protein